jgi:hypothetical protein
MGRFGTLNHTVVIQGRRRQSLTLIPNEGWCINRAWKDQKLQTWPTTLAPPNFAASSTRSIGGWSATVALITGDRSAAEDAVHDAMLKAWQLLEGDWVVLRSAADAPVAVEVSIRLRAP